MPDYRCVLPRRCCCSDTVSRRDEAAVKLQLASSNRMIYLVVVNVQHSCSSLRIELPVTRAP